MSPIRRALSTLRNKYTALFIIRWLVLCIYWRQVCYYDIIAAVKARNVSSAHDGLISTVKVSLCFNL